jgi:hypothetical protein
MTNEQLKFNDQKVYFILNDKNEILKSFKDYSKACSFIAKIEKKDKTMNTFLHIEELIITQN